MKVACITPKKCIHAKRSLPKLGKPKKCSSEFMRLCGPYEDASTVYDEDAFILTVPEGSSAAQCPKTLDNCFNLLPRVTRVPEILAAQTDTSVDQLDCRSTIILRGSVFKLPMRPRMCNITEQRSLYIPTVEKCQTLSSEDLENLSIPDFL